MFSLYSRELPGTEPHRVACRFHEQDGHGAKARPGNTILAQANIESSLSEATAGQALGDEYSKLLAIFTTIGEKLKKGDEE